jgi:hypothetical protein
MTVRGIYSGVAGLSSKDNLPRGVDRDQAIQKALLSNTFLICCRLSGNCPYPAESSSGLDVQTAWHDTLGFHVPWSRGRTIGYSRSWRSSTIPPSGPLHDPRHWIGPTNERHCLGKIGPPQDTAPCYPRPRRAPAQGGAIYIKTKSYLQSRYGIPVSWRGRKRTC